MPIICTLNYIFFSHINAHSSEFQEKVTSLSISSVRLAKGLVVNCFLRKTICTVTPTARSGEKASLSLLEHVQVKVLVDMKYFIDGSRLETGVAWISVGRSDASSPLLNVTDPEQGREYGSLSMSTKTQSNTVEWMLANVYCKFAS